MESFQRPATMMISVLQRKDGSTRLSDPDVMFGETGTDLRRRCQGRLSR